MAVTELFAFAVLCCIEKSRNWDRMEEEEKKMKLL